jgi:hypothetical protein
MAPFNEARGHTRHASSGRVRGSHSGRGRGGRGGRGAHKSAQRDKIFKPTRIDEHISSCTESSDEQLPNEGDAEYISDDHSSDEEDQEPDKTHIKPYNVLLQCLTDSTQLRPKKRKFNHRDDPEDVGSLEIDKDLVEEPEDLEVYGLDELIEPGEEMEPEGGRFYCTHRFNGLC